MGVAGVPQHRRPQPPSTWSLLPPYHAEPSQTLPRRGGNRSAIGGKDHSHWRVSGGIILLLLLFTFPPTSPFSPLLPCPLSGMQHLGIPNSDSFFDLVISPYVPSAFFLFFSFFFFSFFFFLFLIFSGSPSRHGYLLFFSSLFSFPFFFLFVFILSCLVQHPFQYPKLQIFQHLPPAAAYNSVSYFESANSIPSLLSLHHFPLMTFSLFLLFFFFFFSLQKLYCKSLKSAPGMTTQINIDSTSLSMVAFKNCLIEQLYVDNAPNLTRLVISRLRIYTFHLSLPIFLLYLF